MLVMQAMIKFIVTIPRQWQLLNVYANVYILFNVRPTPTFSNSLGNLLRKKIVLNLFIRVII